MKKVNWSKELLEEIVLNCYSYTEVLKKLGLKPYGSNTKTLQKKLNEFNVDYSHFTGQGWQVYGHPKIGCTGMPLEQVLSANSSLSSHNVKERLFKNKLKENKCECCGISEWQGKFIQCELHHINGITTDNRLENLIILCPNCHSQTENFRNKKGNECLDRNI